MSVSLDRLAPIVLPAYAHHNLQTGPHTTSFGRNTRVNGAAFERWGARNKPGKYALHFHLAGEAPQSYLTNNVVFK
jgi:hypothetical protein